MSRHRAFLFLDEAVSVISCNWGGAWFGSEGRGIVATEQQARCFARCSVISSIVVLAK